MAFNDLDKKRIERAFQTFLDKRRPPAHLRSKVDFNYRIAGHSIEIFEIRPCWDKPEEKLETPFAKATYIKTRKLWKVYWRRADLKWHNYTPHSEVYSVDEFIQIVVDDTHACFFG